MLGRGDAPLTSLDRIDLTNLAHFERGFPHAFFDLLRPVFFGHADFEKVVPFRKGPIVTPDNPGRL